MKQMLIILVLLFSSVSAYAAVIGKEVHYSVDGKPFTGYLAYDDSIQGKRPGVLVVHEWWGHNAYARKRADMLAKMGYTALALDMYGSGKQAKHPDDAQKFMQAVISNMPEAEKRFNAADMLLRNQKTVDRNRIAVIGYCFGGGIALHMARTGADLRGVVSFHGSLGTKQPAAPGAVKSRLLVFTGNEDPFAPPEVVKSFEDEMQAAGADLQIIGYPGARHSFTNPQADMFAKQFGMPLAYNKKADEDSWQRMQVFLNNIFGQR